MHNSHYDSSCMFLHLSSPIVFNLFYKSNQKTLCVLVDKINSISNKVLDVPVVILKGACKPFVGEYCSFPQI
jgi:hypothetical protein